MAITTPPALTETEFYTRLKVFLGQVEGNDQKPTLVGGNPTIGIGFDLTILPSRTAVFQEMGITDTTVQKNLISVINNPPSTNSQLQSQLNAKYGQSFVMTTAQIDSVFKTLSSQHVNPVMTQTGLAYSDELIGVVSAHYNGVYGPGLRAAIAIADSHEARAEAWYQIRYIHKEENISRRYSDATVFGLYDDNLGVVSKEEALGIYKMYTKHYNDTLTAGTYSHNGGMIGYDADHQREINLSNGDLTAMVSQNVAFAGYVTQDIDHELARAATAFETAFLKPNGLTLGTINSLNIQTSYAGHPDLTGEDTTARTGYINDLLIGNSNANTLDGKSGNDILIGTGGNDSLTGGDGNDTLIGGNGNDNLVGNIGDDTYILNNDGDVVTEKSGKGNDTVQVQGNNVTSVNYQYIENLKVLNNHTTTESLNVELNDLTNITLSKNNDGLSLHLNHNPINDPTNNLISIRGGEGTDIIKLKPQSENADPLANVIYNNHLKFTDLTAGDKIDMSAFQIAQVVSDSIDIYTSGYYLMAPNSVITIVPPTYHLPFNTFHNESTTDWQLIMVLGLLHQDPSTCLTLQGITDQSYFSLTPLI